MTSDNSADLKVLCPDCGGIGSATHAVCPHCRSRNFRKAVLQTMSARAQEEPDDGDEGDVTFADEVPEPVPPLPPNDETIDDGSGGHERDGDLLGDGENETESEPVSATVSGVPTETKPAPTGDTATGDGQEISEDTTTQEENGPDPGDRAAAGGEEEEEMLTGKCIRCGCESTTKICSICGHMKTPPALLLDVEGFKPVKYRARNVMRVAISQDITKIGRNDPAARHYPEIDLTDFFEEHGTIARKHAHIMRDGDTFYLIDNTSYGEIEYVDTTTDERTIPKQGERLPLKPGVLFIVAGAVGFFVAELEE